MGYQRVEAFFSQVGPDEIPPNSQVGLAFHVRSDALVVSFYGFDVCGVRDEDGSL